MTWNTLLHTVLGVLGHKDFIWSQSGVVLAIIFAGIVQGIDMVRVFRYHHARFFSSPAAERPDEVVSFRHSLMVKLPQIYLFKVILYGLITLLAAGITRSFS